MALDTRATAKGGDKDVGEVVDDQVKQDTVKFGSVFLDVVVAC